MSNNFKKTQDGYFEADSLDDLLNNIPGLPTSKQSTGNNNQMNGEIDAFSILQNKLMQQGVTKEQPQGVFVKEGHSVFRTIQNFNMPYQLAVYIGKTDEIKNKSFVVSGRLKALVVEQNSIVDTTKIDSNQLQDFVIIEAPLYGRFLVKETSIRFENKGPSIIKG